jgi:hypothetical protein
LIHDAKFCFNDDLSKKNDDVDIPDVRYVPKSVNALKQTDLERIRKVEITMSTSKEVTKTKRSHKRRKEDPESPDNPEYGAGMH